MPLVIFDFDGVLADTFADMILFAQEACDEMGVSHIVVPSDLTDLEVMSFATFGRACEVPDDQVEEFVRVCTAKFASKKSPPEIFDELPEVIRELADKNTLVIVTGNTAPNVRAFLAHHNLLHCFDEIIGIEQTGTKAEKIRVVKKRLGKMEKATWYLGDSLSDIRAARDADVSSMAVSWGHQRLEMLMQGRPDVIVHWPAELLHILG